ncbi:AraC family transcriptional regulator, regulatory protein of adaptative response / methylated-DNA-[protein]-cysteine methyltransferase [Chitinophaga ginsengisegetis]|uniref:methylated-DNA--[protein]-cysteine S-methyltransferase n=1 Tax=Chitinophaga ginsengisegetis TaxID=393003 RepID=A0A1T5NL26_9BACT|nr:methylated-DNA--[protein]-cysteine S-methyltransferase [Chitinophaga ginsengisegetis]MDR6565178.1 AraC family transcriptional regulator of adaptative response/methylated-DNA-[protein]-cysteine methyltransferase [Chitinophaga ginsengisegetis]MDR6644905.1 AraC family transcriptional regulator of adaptative response/methylated-DNA-[protein]-cysteine methyltransferase [Chitinophaga ginsengisegetis]MDR6652503.1 AraC family transcriptional regulator of adaptative response/methylated-DNA-[protein]-c
MNHYNTVATAIDYIKEHFKTQPDLQEIAAAVHMSPFHFQRVFAEWAGVTPKKFLQYLTLDYAKTMLREEKVTVFDAAFEAGLSGTGRLHDLFINIESMTPGEYKNGGKALRINYSFAESPFGDIIVASTSKGICHMAFADDQQLALQELTAQFPHAQFTQMVDLIQQNTLYIFTQDWSRLSEIKLHLRGTDFQLKVWEALLKIPMGNLTTYSQLATTLQNPNASRAVGSAVAQNPVAFLIPCHRVIKATGDTGQYHWGSTRKSAIIGWEAAKKGHTAGGEI